jgi:hypothetical protein
MSIPKKWKHLERWQVKQLLIKRYKKGVKKRTGCPYCGK